MKVEVWAGTQSEKVTKIKTSDSYARNWLRTEILKMEKWGSRYNHEFEADLTRIRSEIMNMAPSHLPLNEKREWRVTDEHTGFTFIVGLRKVES